MLKNNKIRRNLPDLTGSHRAMDRRRWCRSILDRLLTIVPISCYKEGMGSEKIENIRRMFHHEWLLIAIDEVDETTTTPLTGRLIAHDPDRDKIYGEEMKHPGNTLTVYSEDGLPQGYAAAFFFHD